MPTNQNSKYITSYTQSAQILNGASQANAGQRNTVVRRIDADTIVIIFHNTEIVTYKSNGEVVLDDGGFKTKFTMVRMSQFSGYHVYQKKKQWWVEGKDAEIAYFSGMALKDGKVYDKGNETNTREITFEEFRGYVPVGESAISYYVEQSAKNQESDHGNI